jgi:hypothetical protein
LFTLQDSVRQENIGFKGPVVESASTAISIFRLRKIHQSAAGLA